MYAQRKLYERKGIRAAFQCAGGGLHPVCMQIVDRTHLVATEERQCFRDDRHVAQSDTN